MKLHFWAYAATVLALLAVNPGVSVAQNSQAADFIVALVNSEPITNAELQAQIKQVTEQRAQQRQLQPLRQARGKALHVQLGRCATLRL